MEEDSLSLSHSKDQEEPRDWSQSAILRMIQQEEVSRQPTTPVQAPAPVHHHRPAKKAPPPAPAPKQAAPKAPPKAPPPRPIPVQAPRQELQTMFDDEVGISDF